MWWSSKKIYKNSDVADTIPPIEQDYDIMTDDLDKVAAFNSFFLQASKLDDSNAELPDNARLLHNGTRPANIEITLEDVADQIKCLDFSISYRPDGIPHIHKRRRRYHSLCSS